MADETNLRGYQAQGYAHFLLGGAGWSTAYGTPEHDAYLRGLAGEPPPCGCVAVLREMERDMLGIADHADGDEERLAWLYATGMVSKALSALGDTEAVE